MSFSVVFRRIAKREFDDAISWYQDRREGLAASLALPSNNNSEELHFRQTSSRVLEAMCAEQCCSVFRTLYISSSKTIGL